MKTALALTLLTLITSSYAASLSTFRAGKIYSGDGRWYKNGETFIFRINEGTGNEENIRFSGNNLQLAHQVKYKICFKITNKDCHLDCKGELVKKISLLNPWEDPESWIPSSEGAYETASESACK